MNIMRGDKKDEDVDPFANLDKSTVFQDTRAFNSNIIDARKCTTVLTKVLFVLNQGSSFTTPEATEVFFAITKLWQSKDIALRRLVYTAVRAMANISQDVIIVTSSLTKDMTGKEDVYRAPAIRALCAITDSTMIQAIERFMKQAIVDRNPTVASAALVSAMHISKKGSGEIVKRWVNETQEALSTDNAMVQYHALGLLYQIRKHDRLAVTKLVTKQIKTSLRSPFGYCLLIRMACKVLANEERSSDSNLYDFLEVCLRHKSEMVVYEAARSIVNLRNVSAREIQPAVSMLQLFLGSPKPTLRYAAVKTLSRVATLHPSVVTTCSMDLEALITDSNRSIATLAITTLLKTGSESSIDRLMKQISSFMSEISDEFKVVVVEAIQTLCPKFPRKHNSLMTFLAAMLREEGGYEYKKAIVDTIITITEENPDVKEAGLAHLCEFIEDCEHNELAVRVLHILGKDGPRTLTPAKFIRYIYNRVILEDAPVRAAAVTALAKFGAAVEPLLSSVLTLLDRCLMDADDEVRDRAVLYREILKQKQNNLNSAYILNGLNLSIVALERALLQYTSDPSMATAPFDLKTVPVDAAPMRDMPKQSVGEPSAPAGGKAAPKAASRQDVYAETLAGLPQLAKLGPLFKSAEKPSELTESETEYVVQCVKHTFSHHVVFQFDVTNTLPDQLLENVHVEMEEPEGFEVVGHIPADSLPYNQPGVTYTIVKMNSVDTVTGTFLNTLKFLVKDCDPTTGEPDDDEGPGYQDEYVLENIDLLVADHMQRVMKPNFAASWEEVGEENQVEETFALSTVKNMEDAVKQITTFMGMQACEKSDRVDPTKSSHSLLLSGVFRGGHDVLVKARLAEGQGVTMKITVRSSDLGVCEIVASSVA